MTFKVNWEQTSTRHTLQLRTIERMIASMFPNKKIISYALMPGGCANLNFKVILENEANPYVLRIYLRDKDACYREKNLYKLLNGSVPLPKVCHINDIDGYRFAIIEFISGITLRELLLDNDMQYNMHSLMHEVGCTLARISAHTFSHTGFFNAELEVVNEDFSGDFALNLTLECLDSLPVQSALTQDTILRINNCLQKYDAFFPDGSAKQLVHADFDPSNILVHNVKGVWKVAAILDWEFAFAGDMLCDVANMLRYAHKMPKEFESAFLQGLVESGIKLPENWRIAVNMLNLLALLDCMKRSDPVTEVERTKDTIELISHILAELD